MKIENNYWLLKTEPSLFSIDDFQREQKTTWEGVRNFEARNNIKKMQVGDGAFIYHSSTKNNGIVGYGMISSPYFPDETAFDIKGTYYDQKSSEQNPLWWAIEVSFKQKYHKVITLSELKTIKALQKCRLLKKGNRLSVIGLDSIQASAIMEYINRGVN